MISDAHMGTMAATWDSSRNERAASRGRRPRQHDRTLDPALDAVARGQPPGAIGVNTLWAMYVVLFVGTALQWLAS